MNIDWFTLIAQLVNFLILVALLRWLLYDPIVHAIERREESIAERLERAERQQQSAEELAAEYRQKQLEFDEQREQQMHAVQQQADEERKQLRREAREAVDQQRDQWERALQRDQSQIVADLRQRVGEAGLSAARFALTHLADADLEAQLCQAFVSRLAHLDPENLSEIRDQALDQKSKHVVRTAFELPASQRERLTQAIQSAMDSDQPVTFQTDEDLICGIELSWGGYRLGWNLDDYVRDLQMSYFAQLTDSDSDLDSDPHPQSNADDK